MARHASSEMTKTGIRNMVLAMTALTLFVVAMIASYSGAFARPTLHHLTVAVAAPQQVVDAISGQDALAVNAGWRRRDRAGTGPRTRGRLRLRRRPDGRDEDLCRRRWRQKRRDRSRIRWPRDRIEGRLHRHRRGCGANVGGRPVGHHRVLRRHLHLHRSVAGRHRLRLHHGQGAQARDVAFAHADADRLLGVVGRRRHGLRRRHARRVARTYLRPCSARCGCTRWPSAARSPVSAAAFGTAASMLLTLFLVVVGNAAAAGPVGRPLLSPFYSTFTMIVPQGSGVALLRSISYFGGHGAADPVADARDMGCGGLSARRPRHGFAGELSCPL